MTDSYDAFIGEILHKREKPAFAGWTAGIRAALTLSTESQAYPYTEAHLTDVPKNQRVGLRRAAGITAATRGCPQAKDNRRVGTTLRQLYVALNSEPPEKSKTQNATLSQINSLPLLDVEQAAATLALLIQRCEQHKIQVNYFDLAQTLQYWGNSISKASQRTRRTVLQDFYTPTQTKKGTTK